MIKRIRTHTFNGRKYHIDPCSKIYGVTDAPYKTKELHILFVEGNSLEHLDNALHEGLEAMDAPDDFLHDKNGDSKTMDLSRFLWRLGYRRIANKKEKRK